MAEQDGKVFQALLDKQKEDLRMNGILSVRERKHALLQLKRMLVEHEETWIKALMSDTQRPAFEAYTCEIALLLNEIDYVSKSLNRWMRSERSRHIKFGYVEAIRKKPAPYGSVLIISPWNYPLQLALMPAISAIAAGNRCVIKPSEYAPATSERLKTLIGQIFAPEILSVVVGDKHTAEQLTSLPFDLLFFTGSQQAGKAVSEQAAQHLTPVIMELGGKNPCILDATGYSPGAIREIVWGKFLNAGQTCIAPDTLFVHESIYEQTISEISAAILSFYGEHAAESKDYGRINNPAHFQKLCQFIAQGKIRHGGDYDAEDLYIAPTILTDIPSASTILSDEIFGPILPVISYNTLEDLFRQQKIQRDALVAYLFTKNNAHIRLVEDNMRSTTISVNRVIQHGANPHVAFGGVGRSGHGCYHGKAGFQAFSYIKTAYKVYRYMNVPGKFPPYSDKNMDIVKKFRRWML